MAVLVALLGCAGSAGAEPIDCSTLLAQCLPDVCFIPRGQVQSPCVVDFGARTVQMSGTLRVPEGGVLSFTAEFIRVNNPLRAREGAQITLEGRLGVGIEKPLSAPAGAVTLRGTAVQIFAPVRARTRASGPGSLLVEAGWVNLVRVVRVNGRPATTDGGTVVIRGGGVGRDIEVRDLVDVSGLQGGTIDISSTTDAVEILEGRLRARGGAAGAGTIRLTGASVQTNEQAVLDATRDAGGGEIRIRATSGFATLRGLFDARGGGGVIEGTSAGGLQAFGDFRVAPGGCLAFSAAGTLDTSGGTFDAPIVPDCPGSPSGAFLDR